MPYEIFHISVTFVKKLYSMHICHDTTHTSLSLIILIILEASIYDEGALSEGFILTVLTGSFLADLGIPASCASSVLIIVMGLCACV